jgi:hypothetical protein
MAGGEAPAKYSGMSPGVTGLTERVLVAEEFSVEAKGASSVQMRRTIDISSSMADSGCRGDKIAFAPLIRLVATGDEVNGDPPAPGEVVERGGHAGKHHGLSETGPMCDHHLEFFGVVEYCVRHRSAFGRDCPVAHENAVEPSVIVMLRVPANRRLPVGRASVQR